MIPDDQAIHILKTIARARLQPTSGEPIPDASVLLALSAAFEPSPLTAVSEADLARAALDLPPRTPPSPNPSKSCPLNPPPALNATSTPGPSPSPPPPSSSSKPASNSSSIPTANGPSNSTKNPLPTAPSSSSSSASSHSSTNKRASGVKEQRAKPSCSKWRSLVRTSLKPSRRMVCIETQSAKL